MPRAVPSRAIGEVVGQLAERVRQIEGARRAGDEGVVSSGCAALDGLLPDGGFRRGSLAEWIVGGRGGGAGTLGLFVARQAAGQGGALVVVDRWRRFYPPGAARLGIDLERLIVVRPDNDADHAWALDQVLRSPGVAAVWAAPGKQDQPTLRRWQLAVEASGVLGLLLRDASARHEPSWAELRLGVEPIARAARAPANRNRRVRVELLRWSGGPPCRRDRGIGNCRGRSGHRGTIADARVSRDQP